MRMRHRTETKNSMRATGSASCGARAPTLQGERVVVHNGKQQRRTRAEKKREGGWDLDPSSRSLARASTTPPYCLQKECKVTCSGRSESKSAKHGGMFRERETDRGREEEEENRTPVWMDASVAHGSIRVRQFVRKLSEALSLPAERGLWVSFLWVFL